MMRPALCARACSSMQLAGSAERDHDALDRCIEAACHLLQLALGTLERDAPRMRAEYAMYRDNRGIQLVAELCRCSE